jgi:hypothetical protein
MDASKLNILLSSNDTSIVITNAWEVGLGQSKQVGASTKIGTKNHVK